MIGLLHGKLAYLSEDFVIVECGGVGYRVVVAPATLARLPDVGDPLKLSTHLVVREDSLTLYGFANDQERALFEELLTVSGVGPKVAQALVSAMPPSDLVDALVSGDESRLLGVPGVGKKLAQRLVVELTDRVGKRGWAVVASDGGSEIGAVVEALTGLGFSSTEARHAARRAAQSCGDKAPLEVVLREALRQMNQ